MKLFNILSVTIIGTLLAVGCSSTSTINSTDGGTSDTAVKTDTGTTPTDTGVKADTATGDTAPARTCAQCQEAECATETTACSTTANKPGCDALFACLEACTTAACQEACITDSMSEPGKDVVRCILAKCEAECTKSQ
jgi:hypothetical protein